MAAVDEWAYIGHRRLAMGSDAFEVAAVDLFCGAGGLSYGLQQAGIPVVAGVDVDEHCRYPFEANIEGAFLDRDVRDLTAEHLMPLWPQGAIRRPGRLRAMSTLLTAPARQRHLRGGSVGAAGRVQSARARR